MENKYSFLVGKTISDAWHNKDAQHFELGFTDGTRWGLGTYTETILTPMNKCKVMTGDWSSLDERPSSPTHAGEEININNSKDYTEPNVLGAAPLLGSDGMSIWHRIYTGLQKMFGFHTGPHPRADVSLLDYGIPGSVGPTRLVGRHHPSRY
jgi:hypothetical protein